jgi:integrase/recombinase XerD
MAFKRIKAKRFGRRATPIFTFMCFWAKSPPLRKDLGEVYPTHKQVLNNILTNAPINMQTITIQPLQHKGKQYIALYYDNNSLLNNVVRQLPNAKWSQTHKCWYLPKTEDHYQALKVALANKAYIKVITTEETEPQHKHPPANAPIINSNGVKTVLPIPDNAINKNGTTVLGINAHILPNMQQHLQLKAYSPSTMRTYLNEMGQYLAILKNTPADELTVPRIKDYLQYCLVTLKLSENTLHSKINALKFYYEQVLRREKFFWEVPRPKKQLQLPKFFNQDEITDIIKTTDNLKHKTMLMLAYSAGLRVSEVVAIKVWHIDSKRMQILVQQAKGKKDRITPLSPILLVMLREYFTVYKPDKKGYLFAGDSLNMPYSSRSLQKVLQQAKERANILKPGSTHALRHSFATHLLDKGTDVTMIMKLLGHNDIKTTLRYLHVTNRDVLKLISPLDDLKL